MHLGPPLKGSFVKDSGKLHSLAVVPKLCSSKHSINDYWLFHELLRFHGFRDQLSLGSTAHSIPLLEIRVFVDTLKPLRSPAVKEPVRPRLLKLKMVFSSTAADYMRDPGAPWNRGWETSLAVMTPVALSLQDLGLEDT